MNYSHGGGGGGQRGGADEVTLGLRCFPDVRALWSHDEHGPGDPG